MKYKKRLLLALLTPCLTLFLAWGAVSNGFLVCERIGGTRQASVLQQLEENAGEYSDDVLVLENTTPERAAEIAARLNAKLRMTSDGSFAALTLPQGSNVTQVLSARENRDILHELSPDTFCELADIKAVYSSLATPQLPSYSGEDANYKKQTNLKYLNLGDTWDQTRGAFANGGKVKVAVIDSGIDIDHPDFVDKNGNRIISEKSYNASANKTVSAHGWSAIDDTHGHGTSVAGVIAAQMNGIGVVGIAPEVELLMIKVEKVIENGEDKGFKNSDIAMGLDYAIEQGVHVINMSFGGSTSYCEELFQKAAEHGIILVAAAGNDGDAEKNYPACNPNVIGVGALADNSWELADYSCFGENTDLVAPGTVYTTAMGGGYAYVQGTSLACPTVVAAVALYISQNGVTPRDALTERLLGTCLDLGEEGKDPDFGHGALDVERLIEAVALTYDYRLTKLGKTCAFSTTDGHLASSPPAPDKQGNLQFEGWYLDARLTKKLSEKEQVLTQDTTLYARWLGATSGDFDYYEYKSGAVRILAYRGSADTVQIPDTLDDKQVCEIAPHAFVGDALLKDISLPSTLQKVGTDAFVGCEGLDVVRVYSASILRAINTSDSLGGMCEYANTILADASLDFDDRSILLRYPYADTVEWSGISYTKYSDHEARWTASEVLIPHIPCSQDGLMRITCGGCGCVIDRFVPMHSIGDWAVAQKATKTAQGEEQRACLTCKTVLETRAIAPYTHLLEFENNVKALTGECTSESFDGISECLAYYSGLNEEERLLVKSDYEQLVALVKLYNENATARNKELSQGMELSCYVLFEARHTLYAIGYCLCGKPKERGVTV